MVRFSATNQLANLILQPRVGQGSACCSGDVGRSNRCIIARVCSFMQNILSDEGVSG